MFNSTGSSSVDIPVFDPSLGTLEEVIFKTEATGFTHDAFFVRTLLPENQQIPIQIWLELFDKAEPFAATYIFRFEPDLVYIDSSFHYQNSYPYPLYNAEFLPPTTYDRTGIHGNITTTLIYSPIPEPVTMLLFGTGLLGLAGISIRRRKK